MSFQVTVSLVTHLSRRVRETLNIALSRLTERGLVFVVLLNGDFTLGIVKDRTVEKMRSIPLSSKVTVTLRKY